MFGYRVVPVHALRHSGSATPPLVVIAKIGCCDAVACRAGHLPAVTVGSEIRFGCLAKPVRVVLCAICQGNQSSLKQRLEIQDYISTYQIYIVILPIRSRACRSTLGL